MNATNPLTASKDHNATERTLLKVRKHIAHYKNKKDIERDINTTTTNTVLTTFVHKDKPAWRTDHDIKQRYQELLSGKIVDPNTKSSVTRFAEVVMQERTYCTLQLHDEQGHTATLVVVCTLPEHAQSFANYWLGQRIELGDYNQENNFQTLVNQFISENKKQNIANTIVQSKPQRSGIVKSITTQYTYT